MYREEVLKHYLKHEVLPQLAAPPYGQIETVRLCSRRPVYLFHDMSSHARVVGKLYSDGTTALDKAWGRAEREYHNLKLARAIFHNGAHGVVSPLGKNRDLSALLVTSYSPGHTMDSYIAAAVQENRRRELYEKLSALARFLAELHDRSRSDTPISMDLPQRYLGRVLHKLQKGWLDRHMAEAIRAEATEWWQRKYMVAESQVIVHGDATPTNFLFPDSRVVGIDFEKMKSADRCWDLGFIAAELKHHFMWRAAGGADAEPFIGHFLWQYVSCRAEKGTFPAITRRLPLYMALGLLRIARNGWLEDEIPAMTKSN